MGFNAAFKGLTRLYIGTEYELLLPVPVAEWSKALVYGRSPAEAWMFFPFLVLCVVR